MIYKINGNDRVVIYPPSWLSEAGNCFIEAQKKIFMAGSIEMGTAYNWQEELLEALDEHKVTLFNPRREDWDSSWAQDMNSPEFYEQVSWELDHIEKSDLVVFYFDGKTKSPISMLELGIVSKMVEKGEVKATVCCPDEFWRKGNIDIVCQRSGIPVFTNKDTWLKDIKRFLKN